MVLWQELDLIIGTAMILMSFSHSYGQLDVSAAARHPPCARGSSRMGRSGTLKKKKW